MKIIGAIMLTAAAAAIGVFKAAEMKKSAATLFEIILFLEIMRNEICTRRTPLKQLLAGSFLPEFKYIKAFITMLDEHMKSLGNKSFSHIWTECVDECLVLLSAESRQALISLGSSIGRYDAELQEASIERCISELGNEYKSVTSSLRSNEKMYIGLGAGMGLVVSIVLA